MQRVYVQWSQTTWFEMGLMKKADWQARWICGVDTDKAVRLPADYYLKKFWVNEDLLQARLYITSLGVYSARVNDVCVSSVLAPGTTQYNKTLYYQTYDVTAQMSLAQENRLMLTVGTDGIRESWGRTRRNIFLERRQSCLRNWKALLCFRKERDHWN